MTILTHMSSAFAEFTSETTNPPFMLSFAGPFNLRRRAYPAGVSRGRFDDAAAAFNISGTVYIPSEAVAYPDVSTLADDSILFNQGGTLTGSSEFTYESSMGAIMATGSFIFAPYTITASANPSTINLVNLPVAKLYNVDTDLGAINLILPSAASYQGWELIFKDIIRDFNPNNFVLTASSGDRINGFGSFTFNVDDQSVRLVSSGENWYILGRYK
jgi:hypothetical protein